MLLKIDNLNKSFGERRVLHDLRLELPRGEILCLLGPSGCGKTTTLRIIGGLLRPDSGIVSLDEQDITHWPPEKRPTAMVFQSYALFPNMTVLKNVTYGLRLRGVKWREAARRGREYLDIAGIGDYANARVHELSGGQQQRVALMRALIVEPKLILLDEPLSNLDAFLREKMRSDIKALQHKLGATMIFVTHDRQEAMSMATRIAVMNDGKIVQIGSPAELYSSPADGFVRDFMGASNTVSLPGGRKCHVRPEDLLFDTQGEIEGVVRQSEFLGFYRTYTVDTEQGLLEIISAKDEVYENGSSVRLAVRCETPYLQNMRN